MADDDSSARNRGGNCIAQLARGCRSSGTAEILIPVIYSAVIEQPAGRVEERGFRRDRGLGAFDKGMLYIAQSGDGVVEIPQVRLDLRVGLLAIGIDQPKIDFAAKFLAQLLEQWRVPIRNWAIGAHKEQDDDAAF